MVMAKKDTNKTNKFDVAVIGGGPAGMMASVTAAESGAKVILIEKNKGLGKKLLLTGNGRCNLTNAEFNLRKLVENYGKGGELLFHAFFVFGPGRVIKFFNGLGVKTKIENNNPPSHKATAGQGRVFPASGKAEDVLDALKKYLLKNKVEICLGSAVSEVVRKGKKIEKLVVGGKGIKAKKYIFCTGGKSYPATGSTGEGFKWARDLGHSVGELSPALVPLRLKEDWVKDLQGVALNNVKVAVLQNGKKYSQETGDVLFTHFGLSGPAVLNISRSVGELLKKGEVEISLDLLPGLNMEELEKKIQEKISKNPKRSVKVFLADFMPLRFADVLTKNSGIDSYKQTGNLAKKERQDFARLLKDTRVALAGLLDFESAMVTAGGIFLKEIDHKTMRSKIVDNLFFAGEMIGIDGKTGGFNLQACWSTGYLAGQNAAK